MLGSWLPTAILLGATAPCVLLLERLAPTSPAPQPRDSESGRRRRGDVAFLVAQTVYLPVVEILVASGVSRLAGRGLLASLTRHGNTFVWAAVVFFAADLAAYWTHRCLHGRSLWRIHRLHHDPRVLDWLSGFRFHPIDAAIEQALPILPFVALGFPPIIIAPYVIAVGLVVAYAHADIEIPGSKLVSIPLPHSNAHSTATAVTSTVARVG